MKRVIGFTNLHEFITFSSIKVIDLKSAFCAHYGHVLVFGKSNLNNDLLKRNVSIYTCINY